MGTLMSEGTARTRLLVVSRITVVVAALGLTLMRVSLLAITVVVVGCRTERPSTGPPKPASAPEASELADRHESSPQPATAPYASELEVLVSFLTQHRDLRRGHPLVIRDTVSVPGMNGLELNDDDRYLQSLLSDASEQVPAELIRNFCAKNDKSEPVWPELQKHLRVVLLKQEELKAIFSDKPGEKQDGWQRFYAKYPGSAGIITISRVGLNRRGDRAMVYFSLGQHYQAAYGRIYVLRKQDGKWVEVPAYVGGFWQS
ncbi:MAG TPA: hypothetical protein PKY77_25610 [Phycisphaerae bacterium]|nr:hypothetical protein [Phycisphaerae bacterium]